MLIEPRAYILLASELQEAETAFFSRVFKCTRIFWRFLFDFNSDILILYKSVNLVSDLKSCSSTIDNAETNVYPNF